MGYLVAISETKKAKKTILNCEKERNSLFM